MSNRHESERPNRYDVGDQVRLEVTFETEDGHAADPTVVICRYQRPSGNTTVLEYGVDGALIKESTGTYYLDIVPDAAGTWHYRWEGSGALTAAAEGNFVVQRSAFT